MVNNSISEKPIYKEYNDYLKKWKQIFREIDIIWKKATKWIKIDQARIAINQQVKIKWDILLKKNNIQKINFS